MAGELITAPMWWGGLLREYPIVAITGAFYYPAPHGAPSSNLPLDDYKGMLLDDDMSVGWWPNYLDFRNGGFVDRTKQIFAIGSLAYLSLNPGDRLPFFESKVTAKTICYHQEMSLKEMVERRIVTPVCWPMVDFDCANSQENMGRICKLLPTIHPTVGASLFDSGGSFHLIFESPVPVGHLPWHLGGIVRAFAQTAPPYRRHVFEGFGNAIQRNGHDPARLERVCDDIMAKICHFDEMCGKGGVPFIVDLRHVAHTLSEWMRFRKNGEGSFGYLRISRKWPEYQSPPYMIARYSPDRGMQIVARPKPVSENQLTLAI